ncbi:MAG: transporter substrate-binding domain-containing protein [Muribaculaceae bacterium]
MSTNTYMRNLLSRIAIYSFLMCAVTGQLCATNTKHKIIAVGDIACPPFEFVDNNGMDAGFDVELFRAIMTELNISYDLKLMKWSNTLKEFSTGKADLVIGITHSPDLDSIYDFTTPPLFIYEDIICRKKEKNVVSTIDEIKGKEIIVYKNWCNIDSLFLPEKRNTAIEVASVTDGIKLLSVGRGDLMICNNYLAQYYIDELNIDNLQIRHLNMFPSKYSIGVHKDNPELLAQLNHGFEMVKSKGIYDSIYKKWFRPEKKNDGSNTQIYIIISAIMLLIMAIILYVFRKKIRLSSYELANQKEQLQLAIRAGNILVWGYNVKKDMLFNIIGHMVPDEGLKLKDATKVIHQDDAYLFFAKMQEILSGKSTDGSIVVRCLYSLENGDEWRYIKKEFSALKDKRGKITEIIGTHKDVTEERLKQTKIDRLLKKYQTVFDASSVGLEIFDANGVIVDYNDADAKILGITHIPKQEMLSKKLIFFNNSCFEEAFPYIRNKKSFEGIIEYNFDLESNCKLLLCSNCSGKKSVEVHITPIINSKGELENIVCASIDVTTNTLLNNQLKQLNKEKDLIIDNMPIGISIYNKEGKLSYVNEADAKIVEITDIQEHLEKAINVFDNPNVPDDVKERLRQGIDGDFIMVGDFDKVKKANYFNTKYCGIKYVAVRYRIIKDEAGDIINYLFMVRDITESYLHQAELEESHKKTRLAVNTSNLFQWDYDSETKSISITRDDGENEILSVEDYKKIIHIEDLSKTDELNEKLNNGLNENFSIDIRIKLKRGEDWQYVTISGTPLKRNKSGKVIKYTGFQRNNTEWFELTQALKSQNELNQIILDNVNSGLVYVDKFHRVIWENVSEKFPLHLTGGCKLFETGLRCEDSHSNAKLPCDKCLVETVLQSDITAKSQKTLPGGHTIEITANAVIGIDGKPNGAVLCVEDITNRKQLYDDLQIARDKAVASHQLLSEILDQIPCAIFIKDIDNDFKYIIANRLFCHCSEMSQKDILGKNDDEIFGKEISKSYNENDLKAVNENKAIVIQEETVINEEHLFWRTTKTPLKTYDGSNLLIALGVNLTEIHNKNMELKKAKDKAEQSDKLKSAFLANMSHEIRTPLNAIVGFSELLTMTTDDEEKKSYSNIIATNNDLLLRLINDILDLSKIDAGVIELHNMEFDMASLFEEMAFTLKPRFTSPDVEFIIDSPYKHCLVKLDKNRVSQVLINYMTNAIKYTTKGYVKMGYKYVDGGIKIYVEDSGIGISDEKKPKVFGRFQKLDEFAQGTGLGLSICKALVELYDGKVGFTSQEGKGSTFWAWSKIEATITTKDDNEIESHLIEETPVLKIDTLSSKAPKKCKILIAEDNDSNYLLIGSILKDKCEISRAINGKEAVEYVKNNHVDCILMDINMPILNGIEATKIIRQFNPKTPIIAVTANAFESDRYKAIESGCNDFIAKPIKKTEIISIIEKYLGRHI